MLRRRKTAQKQKKKRGIFSGQFDRRLETSSETNAKLDDKNRSTCLFTPRFSYIRHTHQLSTKKNDPDSDETVAITRRPTCLSWNIKKPKVVQTTFIIGNCTLSSKPTLGSIHIDKNSETSVAQVHSYLFQLTDLQTEYLRYSSISQHVLIDPKDIFNFNLHADGCQHRHSTVSSFTNIPNLYVSFYFVTINKQNLLETIAFALGIVHHRGPGLLSLDVIWWLWWLSLDSSTSIPCESICRLPLWPWQRTAQPFMPMEQLDM